MIVGYTVSMVAQTTASATNQATCTIISPIGITAGDDLAFGNIIAGAGAVVVATDNTRTIPGALNAGTQVGTITAASFSITGEAAYTYSISLPADDAVTITEGTDPMAVTSFVASSASDGAGLVGTLDVSGDDVVKVGATLTVAADQEPGDYTGDFSVTVAYN